MVLKSSRILVFIPMYNCAPQIPRVIRQLADPSVARLIDGVVCVNNRSSDQTEAAAAEGLKNLDMIPHRTLLRNDDNYGLGGSHKVAFRYARQNGFTHVLVIHGDDQGQIADIMPVLERGEHLRYDACLGARFMPGSRLRGYSRFRTFGNHVFNLIFSMVARRRIYDLGSGLNIFAASVFEDNGIDRYADDLRFNIFLLLGFICKKRRIMFFPILWTEDDQVSNVKMFSQALKTLAIAADYLFRPQWFVSADHRDTPRADYSFNTLLSIADRPQA